jgi:hypothetical protein
MPWFESCTVRKTGAQENAITVYLYQDGGPFEERGRLFYATEANKLALFAAALADLRSDLRVDAFVDSPAEESHVSHLVVKSNDA